MGNSLLAWANVFKSGSILAGASEAALGAGNLSSDQCSPASGWQTPSGVLTAANGATLRVNAATPSALWRVVSLDRSNLTAQASIDVILWSGSSAIWADTISGPAPGYGQSLAVMDQDYNGSHVTIEINDPANPDGFINVAGACAGPAWLPLSGMTWDTAQGEIIEQDTTASRGGNQYVALLSYRRTWKLALDTIRDSEIWASLGELKRIAALGVNVLFIPDITYVDMNREAVFGTLVSTADVTFPGKINDARAWRGLITERL